MKIAIETPDAYIDQLPIERKEAFIKLQNCIISSLPKEFKETIQYGMISYVVPFEIYPSGYHCDSRLPLPFLSIASQKNFIALYHMGIYATPKLLDWFVAEHNKVSKSKLDMGKSCIRFKKPDQIPFSLISELCKKISPTQWIEIYESTFKK